MTTETKKIEDTSASLAPPLCEKIQTIRTATGRLFTPLDPKPADITIEDIAQALSLICAHGGRCRVFYSLAEQSVRLSLAVEKAGQERTVAPLAPEALRKAALFALMCDASAAYVGDRDNALATGGACFWPIWNGIRATIDRAFALPGPREEANLTCVTMAFLFATEKRDVLAEGWSLDGDAVWGGSHPPPLPERIDPWTSSVARERFLDRFALLSAASSEASR